MQHLLEHNGSCSARKIFQRTSALARMMLAFSLASLAAAAPPAPLSSLERLPVKEVTVFKDGHAFVAHEGKLPTDGAGNVLLDYLPTPVIGTFWAYSTDKNVKLAAITASQQKVWVERTALNLRELLEANVSAPVIITEVNSNRYSATLLGFPERSSEELAKTSPPGGDERLPEKGNLVLLQTSDGVKAVGLERIQDVTFSKPHKPASGKEEFRSLLALKLDWGRKPPAKSADIGLVYVQKGIRWIPSYKVDLDGNGNAVVRLQATILNELTDLDDATVQLVIGVPTFAFKDTIDPMALQQTAAQLSAFFQGPASGSRANALAANFSNAMMTQVARMGDYRAADTAGGGPPADLPEGAKNEDLYVFTLKNVRLKKGARMVVPVAEYTVPYKDAYVLEMPFAPPAETWRQFNNQQQVELARLFSAPKAMHKVRLANKSPYPFTTAPALVLKEGKVIAQGMMTYASPGASVDLNLTTAVDIQVKKTDNETKRTPNAFHLNGNNHLKVELAGAIKLTNHRAQAVEVEVIRYMLGHTDSAGQEGVIQNANVFETTEFMPAGEAYPTWWHWYSWPWWWHHVNGVGKVTWNVKLDPGKSVDLSYAWHYLWL